MPHKLMSFNGKVLRVKEVNSHPAVYPDCTSKRYKAAFGVWPNLDQYYLDLFAKLSDEELAETWGVVRDESREPPFIQPNLRKALLLAA